MTEQTTQVDVIDGAYVNFVSNLNTDRDKASHGTFQKISVPDDQIEAVYQDWLAKKIINRPVQDMLRAGWYFTGIDEDQSLTLQAEMARVKLVDRLYKALIWMRKYGKSFLLLGMADGKSLDQPLDLSVLSRGQLQFITVLKHSEVSALTHEYLPLELTAGEPFQPKYYEYKQRNNSKIKVHSSRLIKLANGEEEESALLPIYYTLRNFASTNAGAASLVHEAKIDVIKFPGLMDAIKTRAKDVLERFGAAALMKSLNGMLVIDANEQYESKSYTFGGLPELSWTDERKEAQNRIENYNAKGAQIAGTPLDTHWKGMKSLQVAMFPQEAESSIGKSIVLISNEGKALEIEQFLRITEVSTRTAFMVIEGGRIEYKIATYGLSDALKADFVGLSAKQWYSGEKSTTIIRDAIVADTGKYYSSANLKDAAQVGDYSVVAEDVYTQLVPSAQTETPMVNINAAGDSVALVKAKNGVLSKTFSNVTINTVSSLYLGSSIMPKSVEFTLFGSVISDVGGELKNAAGTSIGTINYQNGSIVWNASAGTGTTNLTINFMPAAAVTAPVESELIYVNQENIGFNWLRNLVPLPSPGSLQVSYLVQNQVYTLRDNGAGQLRGADSSFGSGSIDYDTGTMVLTTGELADVGSAILMTWSNMITAQERSGLTINKAYVEIPVNDSIVAGTLTVDWLLNGVTKTATDNGQGQFTGDATGNIDYADGVAKLMPTLLPNGGTTFNVSGQKGTKASVQVTAVPTSGAISIELDNGSAALVPKSVKVRVPVKYMNYLGEVELRDMPIDATTGRLINGAGQQQGTINYASRTMSITPSTTLEAIEREKIMQPFYGKYNTSQEAIAAGMLGMTIKYENTSETHTLSLNEVATAVTVSVSYRDSSVAQSWSDTVIGSILKTDLTEGFAEQILAGSVRFTLAGSTYVDKLGSLYRNPSVTTGAGTVAGQIHYGNGAVELSAWDVGGANNPTLETLVTQLESVQTNQVSYRAPMIPIRAQSLTLSATKVEGGVLNITPDGSGTIDTAECDGFFNFDQGYGQFVFRQKIEVTSANRAEIMAQDWYVAELEYSKDGKQWIHKPIMVLPETIKYSAVGYSYIPIDAELLGLSAVRLPIDGRVPIFRSGEIGIVSASKSQELPDYIAGQTYPLNDARISWCELEDADGIKIPFDMYTVDYDYGKVTLNGDFALGNLTGPLTAKYRYQDMGLVRDVKINGQVTFTKPLTHNYDPVNTIVGSALVIGDMQARYTRKFVQSTWDSLWKDEAVGAAISANYNDTLYPIAVTNKGNIQERWALVFTGNTSFRIIGETSGQIGTGVTTDDCSPINPVTNAPYFTIKKEGWGNGWASGNVLRFNTIAANHPIWVIRTVKQSEPTILSDSFQIMLRGDIDRIIQSLAA